MALSSREANEEPQKIVALCKKGRKNSLKVLELGTGSWFAVSVCILLGVAGIFYENEMEIGFRMY